MPISRWKIVVSGVALALNLAQQIVFLKFSFRGMLLEEDGTYTVLFDCSAEDRHQVVKWLNKNKYTTLKLVKRGVE